MTRSAAASRRRSSDEADDDPGLLLWQVTNRWQAAQRAALRPYGLTHVQFVLLAALGRLTVDGPVTQRELAEHAATDPMMTSQVVRTLEANGWLRREVHADDGRAWAVRITRSGAALARRAEAAVSRCDADFFAPLGPRAAAFARALGTLRDAAH
jgi:DNA-binding MarR family transcriptional regulator